MTPETEKKATGPFFLWISDAAGKTLERPADGSHPNQDPLRTDARQVVFSPNPQGDDVAVPAELEVCHVIDRILYQLRHLYGAGDPSAEARFRKHYKSVFDLGRSALETRESGIEEVKTKLRAIEDDLLKDQWTLEYDAQRHKTDVPGGAQVAETKASPQATAEEPGPFLLWTTDDNGEPLQKPADGSHPEQYRQDKRARHILYTRQPLGKPPTTEEMSVHNRIDRLLHALGHLYPAGDAVGESRFRRMYVALFGVGRACLETKLLDPAKALAQLEVIEAELVDDEGWRVKTRKIREHLRSALWLSAPVAVAFVILTHVQTGGEIDRWLNAFHSSRVVAANLMLLLLGCFLGVCVSYAYRKPQFNKADDLVAAETDQLTPMLRLLLTGMLAFILIMFAGATILDVRLGTVSLMTIFSGSAPAQAFAIGILCGIAEQLLPAKVLATRSLFGGEGGSQTRAAAKS